MRHFLRICICAVLLGSSGASATLMEFTATSLGGVTWQFDYSVTNDTLAFDIEQFTIYFDHSAYANLATVADEPAGWDSIVIQPDTGLPDDGFYDSLALIGGIAPGETLSGFSLTVDYLGSGFPGDQLWEVVDPLTFATLDQGASFGTVVAVGEPTTLALFLFGMIALVVTRHGHGA